MFKQIEIDKERELEDLVIKDPDAIEQGLKCLTHQRHASGNFIDVLAVDADGVLVVIELKIGEDDEMLFQALDYYDWVASNRDRLANEYQSRAKIVAEEDPRIVLVASNFTDRLKRAMRYFEPRTTLMEYSCLTTKGGEKGLFCKEVFYESENGFVPSISLENSLSYVKPENVRRACKKVHDQIVAIGPDMESVPRDGYIRFKCKNRVVGDISLRRTFFVVWWCLGNNEWDGVKKLASLRDWEVKKAKVLKAYAKQYHELGGS
ncbi:MAG TPA: endonuclease NucS domain-containing protein [Verrucomicrobiae bacterium]|jgi:hypothetical protein|nr:endonuclease NucS domain-containing protein [Verrucomicrobiae bacterium]